ncbi:alpha-ribazole phosphatase [Thermovirga lienii]|uniref:alpha-ribazole phosphatase n=1 Tax=Thermovirga lienii TaxID=336261 RepID=UPI000ECB5C35|nr:alpha-ribazole phosphatase [Thermovirga lienii]
MIKLILIRHGESKGNKELRYTGHTNVPLTEEGRHQARHLAIRLRKENITAIYSSDLRRAFDTASCIAEGVNLSVVKEPLLRELHFGDWEGLTYNEIIQGWGELWNHWFANPLEVAPPGGETLLQLQERVLKALFKITAKHKDGTVVLVSHAGPIKCILCYLNSLPLSAFWDIAVPPGSLMAIQLSERQGVLLCERAEGRIKIAGKAKTYMIGDILI